MVVHPIGHRYPQQGHPGVCGHGPRHPLWQRQVERVCGGEGTECGVRRCAQDGGWAVLCGGYGAGTAGGREDITIIITTIITIITIITSRYPHTRMHTFQHAFRPHPPPHRHAYPLCHGTHISHQHTTHRRTHHPHPMHPRGECSALDHN